MQTSEKNLISLCFLHGFLGCKEDWTPLIFSLEKEFHCHAVDLPGHGDQPWTENLFEWTYSQLQNLYPKPRVLIGYSLGGRLALKLKELYPDQFDLLIILSGHPGLATEQERVKRKEEDQKWIQKLKHSLNGFLRDWYAQDLFTSLRKKEAIFQEMLQKRMKQDPQALIKIFETFSPAHHPPSRLFSKTYFLYGEEDLKYAQLYFTLPKFVTVKKIEHAGHVLHLENPKACIEAIKGAIYDTREHRTSKN